MTPVGVFSTSAANCGAHDMAGNVWEWFEGCWHPKDFDYGRVLRGGSWNVQAVFCRSSVRIFDRPDDPTTVSSSSVFVRRELYHLTACEFTACGFTAFPL